MRQLVARLAVAATVFLAAPAISGTSAIAQSVKDVVGTWTLVSSVTERDGKRTEQFGAGAAGMLSLDANGHFMLTIIGPELPRFASNNDAFHRA